MNEQRPWGHFEILTEGEGFKVKRIVVNPDQRLSLQSHKHRSEVWTVVQGQGVCQLEDRFSVLTCGDYIHIPVGCMHRLINNVEIPLVLIEVQTGSYLGEDDIWRYEDDYNRA